MRFKITRRRLAVLGFALALLVGTMSAAPSGTFSIDWWTADGGGGTSSGGNYTLSGTAGQADAGTLAGGGLSLQGGFWSAAASRSTIYLPRIKR